MNETFYDRILFLLKVQNKRIETFYKELEIPKSTVQYWKKTNALPTGEWIVKLSDYFNVSTDFLLKGTECLKNNSLNNSIDVAKILDSLEKINNEIAKLII